jgi:hypothetical protein
MFKLGEVKVPCDQDFEDIKNICQNEQGWNLDFNKKNVKVWLKNNELSSFQMIKVKAEFDDISAALLYNVLMDTDYRSTWDEYMLEGSK